MKKNSMVLFAIFFILINATTILAQNKKGILMQIDNNIAYTLENDVYKAIDIKSKPVIDNSTTLVPIRSITELFGGKIDWDDKSKQIKIQIDDILIEMTIDNNVSYVNSEIKKMQIPPKLITSSAFVPLRFISENIGLKVLYEPTDKLIYISNYDITTEELKSLDVTRNFKTSEQPKTPQTKPPDAITYETKSVANISTNIITVDLKNSNLTLDVIMPGNKLNNTATFKNIVTDSNAIAAINGNFFNAYDQIKDPIGSIMRDGKFLYVTSGLPSMGITKNKDITFGNPAIFTKITTTDTEVAETFTAYEVNVLTQAGEQAVLYTPARGNTVSINNGGAVVIIENDIITKYYAVLDGDIINIPSNGYVLYLSQIVLEYPWTKPPTIGGKININYELFVPDPENFEIDNIVSVVSGAPRLIKNGTIDNSPLPSGFANDQRFLSNSAPRTAVGELQDGRLVFVSCTSTITQLKNIMLDLNCKEAINIDGGASTAMFYKGNYIKTPSRELTSVIIIKEN